jgi:type IV pilus assembly protein PilA
MKSELKAKFITYLAQSKKNNEGFTLIELLVVIIIIGILSAIALPSFLNQANKAKQSEAKQYVGALVRSQQAYYLENSNFTSDPDELGRVVKAETTNYKYPMTTVNQDKTNETVRVDGESLKAALKPYVGQVKLNPFGKNSEATTLATLCESKKPFKGVATGTIAAEGATPADRCGADALELGLK